MSSSCQQQKHQHHWVIQTDKATLRSDSGRIKRQILRLVEVEGREVWKKLKPPDIFHRDLSDSLPPLLFSYKATLGPNSTQTWSYLTFRSSQYYNIFCQSEPSCEYLRNNKEQCSRRSGTTIKMEADTWPSNHVVSQQLNTTCIPMGTASQKTQSNST